MAYVEKPWRQEQDAVDVDALHNREGAITDKMLNIEGRQTNILPLPVRTTKCRSVKLEASRTCLGPQVIKANRKRRKKSNHR
jgi:hypothetical protein